MNGFFAAGCLCLTGTGGMLFAEAWKNRGIETFFWLAAAAASLAGLIYTLFFALPFDATYRKEADGHKVCRSGMYGWCRHPGIWWFFGCFLALGMACWNAEKLCMALALSFLNLGYAWYQDRYIFPEEFCDYEDYQREVPFLIPGKRR